ncbi:MAG TPA: hypothetical protein VFG86_25905, partial [Chloroflexota bacterium]|nr:hypothetical protein [Chloroflexota bacterium]
MAPPHNPFDVSLAYAVVMSLALALALLPGLGTGLLLVLLAGLRLPLAIGWPQLAQAHGQIQALGYVLLFIVAVGLQLFPRFLGTPTRHAIWAVWGACSITLALLARWAGQPLAASDARAVLLTFAAIGVPVGAVVGGLSFHGLSRTRALTAAGPGAWRRFLAIGGLALGSALVLYVTSSLELARGGVIVPLGLDEALIHLELAGFATCLVFAVASRVFGRFLLLRTSSRFESLLPMLAGAWLIGLVLVAGGWLLDTPWAAWP